MTCRKLLPLAALLSLTALAPLPASAQLISRLDLSFDMALAAAQGTLLACRERGFPVAVVVVNRDGETIVTLRADNAGPHTVENARRKAYTALSFKISTQGFLDEMKT